ncbi:hypothetical protein IG631_18710 [Alternaria alternata]|nr:hypothetical protein IG631_18710 [Alternaria alternata]
MRCDCYLIGAALSALRARAYVSADIAHRSTADRNNAPDSSGIHCPPEAISNNPEIARAMVQQAHR